MDSLQIAQVIADLQSLQNAEPVAAGALLSANKVLSARIARRNTAASSSSIQNQSTTTINGSFPPELTRSETDVSSDYFSSTNSSQEDEDEDLKRAKTLMHLFQMKDKFHKMSDTGLSRAKEKVDEAVARFLEKDLERRDMP